MDVSNLARRAEVLRALGDEGRLRIVDLLCDRDLSPAHLSEALGMPGNLLAHHLNVLVAGGVVRRSHSGGDRRRTYVQLLPAALDGLLPGAAAFEARRVVFVCTHNSARSVMADAAWREVSDVPSTSAGTDPADAVNPRALTALRSHGLAAPATSPQRIDDVLRPDDVIVSVCDAVNEQLDTRPHRQLHWSIADPATADTDDAFATALSEIEARVRRLAPHVGRARRPAKSTA